VSYRHPDGTEALRDVDFTVGSGEVWHLLGASGSGKSTLLHILDGLRRPTRGEVRFRGRSVDEASLKDPGFLFEYRAAVGLLFQDPDAQLFCDTVEEELRFGPRQRGWAEDVGRARVEETLALLGLAPLAGRSVERLSGGERRLVALGSVLSGDPEVLLLDEPTGDLDPRRRRRLMTFLASRRDAGKTLVIATHDLALVRSLGGRAAVLDGGHRVRRTGAARDILTDRTLLAECRLIDEEEGNEAVAIDDRGESHGNDAPRPPRTSDADGRLSEN
jgi:cobalt/nickel transport system ATP-binding protein